MLTQIRLRLSVIHDLHECSTLCISRPIRNPTSRMIYRANPSFDIYKIILNELKNENKI